MPLPDDRPPTTAPQRVVVVGGGVSGLATAYHLACAARSDIEVVLVERDDRLGGKVRTHAIGGHLVDAGPDALMVRAPAMRALLDDLDLADATVAPGAGGSFVWSRGRLRTLPPSTMFGIPERLLPLLLSGLLSPRGIARAGLDLVLPRRKAPADEDLSVGALLRPRFGTEVFDRLVDPLLGGIHAGRADLLSARSTVPEIDALVRRSRSVYLALRRQPRRSAPTGPALVSLHGGLTRLVGALTTAIAGCDIRLGTAVEKVERDGDRYVLQLSDGSRLVADAVVLTTPAFVTAPLLADLAPDAAAAAAGIAYVDSASITLVYPREALGRELNGTGFLVPAGEDLLLVGCSWLTAKWPHLAGESTVLLRAMVGRYGDQRISTMDDDELVARVRADLVRTMGMSAPPVEVQVQRWPRAMPQYTVGHQDRLDRISRALQDVPGVHVIGAACTGVGVASCVGQARRTADEVLTGLAQVGARTGGTR
ncbi:MAG: protoporphyrinogen oxidase [Cellulomonas sp.]